MPIKENMNHKKRVRAQLIGQTGEGDFLRWANRNQLNVTKWSYDYGFDFLAQYINGTHATSQFLNVQCKSNENKNEIKCAIIEKDDVLSYLSSNCPVILAGIDTSNSTVYPCILDEALSRELIDFYKSSNASHGIKFSTLDKSATFSNDLSKACSSFYLMELRTKNAEYIIGNKAKVSANVTPNGTIVVLDTRFITELIDPNVVFNSEMPSSGNVLDVSVIQALKLVNLEATSIGIRGRPYDTVSIGSINGCAETTAFVYSYKGNICYRMKCGICISAGPCYKKGGRHYHDYSITFEQSLFGIVDCFKDYEALESIIANKKISIDGHELMSNQMNDNGLESAFKYIENILRADEKNIVSFAGVTLNSINNKKLYISISLICRLILNDDISDLIPGAYITTVEGNKSEEINDLIRVKKNGVIHIGITVANKTYVAKIACDYNDLILNDLIVGVEPIKTISIEIFEDAELGILDYPVMWIYKGLPSIILKYEDANIDQIEYPQKYYMA
jgi:hypothetical protein